MKIIQKTIFLAAIIFSYQIHSQVTQEWAKTFNGSGNNNDEAKAMTGDSQGNVIITGQVISTGVNLDFGTVKYNSDGIQQWAVIYNGPNNNADEAIDVVVDNSGNVYVTGWTEIASGNYDMVTIKYNSSGVQQWAQIWGNTANQNDLSNAIALDNSGNVYITGSTEVTGSNVNYITLKYNNAGTLQWAKQYNNPINSGDEALDIITDASNNVYVTGRSSAAQTGTDFLTIKYSSSGDSSWVKRYSGPNNTFNDIPCAIGVDGSGNVYVTGFSPGTSTSIDYLTVKYDPNGAELWVKRYDSGINGQDIPEDMEVDASGNVYITGRIRPVSSYNDFGTIKYNSAGVLQWAAVYNNTGTDLDDYGYDLTYDAQGNVYVTGNSQTSGSDRDVLTIKYSSTGTQLWAARYDVTNSEEGYAIHLDANNNVYTGGYQDGANSDFLTIKYSQSTGVTNISSEVPARFSLSQNYPNPFNPSTKIKFDIPTFNLTLSKAKSLYVKLTVYDVLGKEIAVLVNESLRQGIYETGWDASDFPSGVYFYKLVTDGFTETKKMILIK